MAVSATLKDIELLCSHNKKVRIKASLLNENYREVESLTGTIKSISYDSTSESDIRRTSSVTLVMTDKSQINTDFESVWIKRMVELSVGIFDFSTQQYVWYPLGRMLMTNGNTTYNATVQEVKLSLVDLMAVMTEERGSQMGSDLLIRAGTNVRDALIAIVTTFSPFKRYSIPEFEDTVPYDITISIGQYPHAALMEILNLFPYYEMYYDIEGIFTVQKIPMKKDDPISISATIIDDLLISENRSVDFKKVRNTTEIWGRSLDAHYTALSCTSTAGRYDLFISDSFKTLEEGYTYGFTPDADSSSGQTIKIQETEEYPIYIESGSGRYTPIEAYAMYKDVPYVVRYTNEKFVLQGELEIHVIYQEVATMPSVAVREQFKQENACRNVKWFVNPESPFACTLEPTTGRIEREIRQVLEGGEYGNIYTTQLAYERAAYETYLRTRVQDTVELEMVLIPWMDINDKIQYTSPTSGKLETMIVQGITYDFKTWTMVVKCSKFYPYYPW